MGNTNMKYHLVYGREYYDSSQKYDPYFYSYSTIFRNVSADLVPTLMSFKDKIKKYCDKNYKEEATNFQNRTIVKIYQIKNIMKLTKMFTVKKHYLTILIIYLTITVKDIIQDSFLNMTSIQNLQKNIH